MLRMKNFILISTVSFLSSLNFSGAEDCSTEIVTDCLTKPTLSSDEQVELEVLHDANSPTDQLQNLFKFICAAQTKFPNNVKIRMMVGASVTKGDDGIVCEGGDCAAQRREACIVGYEKVATTCNFECPSTEYVDECVANNESDGELVDTGALRCKLGIDVAKIPAVVVNETYYDPCATFTCEQDMITFICGFYENLEGC